MNINQQFTALSNALQKKGYRFTAARQAILQTLVGCGGHITADDLAVRVREAAPNVGRMTVYRTLDLLSELGLIRPVYQGTGAAHYVLMDDGHHHHLICSACHKVIEFDDCMVGETESLICNRFGFKVQGHLVEVYGRCPDCQ
ncbi:MAG: transcriptional repressor [Chloroflexi bacterium]|nr:transcriptional repressor [Chloroflexota bacterium]